MKKHLFIFSLAMAALAANAQTKQPATITTYKPADLETVLYCVSENGKYPPATSEAWPCSTLKQAKRKYTCTSHP